MAGSVVRRALLAVAATICSRAVVAAGQGVVGGAVAGFPPSVRQVLRIACVGDSLTEGYHASGQALSYPSVLQNLMGPDYFVMNFGHSGATLTGPQPAYPQKIVYQQTPEYTSSLQSEPDIVIIMIGSNDATSMVWPMFHQDFEPAYMKLVGIYQALPTQPLVFVAVPPPLYKDHAYGMLQAIINTNYPAALPRIASTMRLPPPISIFEAFKARCPVLSSTACPYISGMHPPHNLAHDDGCHPNDQGYTLIATTVHEALMPFVQMMGSPVPVTSAYETGMPVIDAGLPDTVGAVQPEWWAKRRRLQAEASSPGREQSHIVMV